MKLTPRKPIINLHDAVASAEQSRLLEECIRNRDYVAKAQEHIQECGLQVALAWILAEIVSYCGAYWKHDHPNEGRYRRNGNRPGSIWVGGEKKRILIQRILDRKTGKTFLPKCYSLLRKMSLKDRERLTLRISRGIVMRDYRLVEDAMEGGLGLSASSVSRIVREESRKALERFESRDLSAHRYVAITLDGTYLYGCQMMVCLGFTDKGEVHVLGITELSTENADAVEGMLQRLIARGLRYDHGLLFVVDGAKGIHKGIRTVFGRYAMIQRCHWHKRENVAGKVRGKKEQKAVKAAMTAAYEEDTYAEAKKALLAICADLESKGHHSAANSLREGLEDTLTLHRLRVGKELRQQLRTTNRTEHVNSRIKHDVRRIKRWNNSNQTQRWTVMAVLDAERRLNRIVYQDQLDALKQALWEHVSSSQNTTETEREYLTKSNQN